MDNLTINTTITAKRPICPCKGGGFEIITSTIKKIITNPNGTWYYLENGSTVQSTMVISTQ